ncbi:thioredoxin fold domain-containing protein [Phorcysia thermohydrogeniphila]|uniref:Thiol:disulfide interchange protein DsbC n=1 Tax=Phorcysia thermohydrogeniphila TaxID=936138 RepID=A0A4R1G7U0_9BACT|nr:thioredoxin fold domain-containing protein [Phorcysia thermohydrogeniphila]TCK02525.1 thiol:disulfide interchange protein DsbC [Phorcysia thermohydrogeniphila]
MKVKQLLPIFTVLVSSFASYAQNCPPVPEVQSILNRTLKTPFTAVSVEPVESFSACKVKTAEGETFFLSLDKKFLIEGFLTKVPPLKISEEDYLKLRKNVLFSTGKGEEIIVVTNPLCNACRQNREKLKKLVEKVKLSFVPAAFNREQEKVAVDAVCRKKDAQNFFEIQPPLLTCDRGKLKVWTVSDTLKKYGITGTPVFIFPDRSVTVGILEFSQKISDFIKLTTFQP